ALGRAHTVIAITRAVAESLSNAGVRMQRLRIIPNGIQVPIPKHSREDVRSALGIAPNAPVAIVVARLMEDKGVAGAIKAHTVLRQRAPNAVLLIAGDGPDRDALELMAEELGVESSVRFLGYRDDVPDLLAASDVCIIPSVFEGQSLVALEAMALGIPVVATSVGGLAEVVQHDKTGLLVDPMNHAALADAAFFLIQNKERARQLAEAGRNYVLSFYTRDIMVSKVAEVYRSAAL
ncbi:MAG: glycosyltransferase, partial [Armatimonadota bacterium]